MIALFFVIIGAGIVIAIKNSRQSPTQSTPSTDYTVIDDKPYINEKPQVMYDKTALRCEKGKGLIGYYHLEDWFNENFTEAEFAYLKEKLSKTMMNPDTLNKGIWSSSNQSASKFLDSLAYNFNTKKRH